MQHVDEWYCEDCDEWFSDARVALYNGEMERDPDDVAAYCPGCHGISLVWWEQVTPAQS